MASRFFVFFLCWCSACAVAQPLPALVPYTDGAKWGYADTTGRIVISPQWDDAAFFDGDRAVVRIYRKPGQLFDAVHCLIDRRGRYIIPPAVGWRGHRTAGDASGLNVVDSAGRWGLVDTTGAMLIPHAWDGSGQALPGRLRDRFFIAHRDGLAGIVDRNGAVMVPPVWGSEMYCFDGFDTLGAVVVTDPDNQRGYNRNGVVTLDNRVILPARYYDVEAVVLPGGRPGIRTTQASHNEVDQFKHPVYTPHWFDFATGKEVPAPVSSISKDMVEFGEPGGYISFAPRHGYMRGLMDSTRRLLIPCCSVKRVTNDTIYLQSQTVVGADSLVITDTYLDARTRNPLGPPKVLVLYHEETKVERSQHHHFREYYRPPKMMLNAFGGEVHRFYKDSMLYSVVGPATAYPDEKLYIVSGASRTGKSERYATYYAVLNSDGEYAVGPLRDFRIQGYLSREGLAIANGYSARHGANGYTVLSPGGEVLMRPVPEEILDAFSWRGSVYAYAVERSRERNGLDDGPSRVSRAFLLDSGGKQLRAFARYEVVPRFYRLPGSFLGAKPVLISDTSRLVAHLWPDGKTAYPKLSFRFSSVELMGNDWAIVTKTAAVPQTLVNIEGRQIPKAGVRVYQLARAIFPSSRIYTSEDEKHLVPRVYFATAYDEAAEKKVHFYLDDRGRAYYSGAALVIKKSTRQ